MSPGHNEAAGTAAREALAYFMQPEVRKVLTMDPTPQAGSRMTARGVIEEEIRKLRRRADGLEQLMDEMPELKEDADQALWEMLCRSR